MDIFPLSIIKNKLINLYYTSMSIPILDENQIYNLFKRRDLRTKNNNKEGFNCHLFRYVMRTIPTIIANYQGFEYFPDSDSNSCSIENFFNLNNNKPIRLLEGDVQIGKTNAICLYLMESRMRGFQPAFMTAKCSELADQFISSDVPSFNDNILWETIDNYLFDELEKFQNRNRRFRNYLSEFHLDNRVNLYNFKKCLFNLLKIRPFRFRNNNSYDPKECFDFKTWCRVPVFLIESSNLAWALNLVKKISTIQHLEPALLIDEFHNTLTDMEGKSKKVKLTAKGKMTLTAITFLQYIMKSLKSNGIIIGISATHLRSYIHPNISKSIGARRSITVCSFYINKGLVYRGKNSLDDNLAVFNEFDFGSLKKTTFPANNSTELLNLLNLINSIVENSDPESKYQTMILANIFTENECHERLKECLLEFLGSSANLLVINQKTKEDNVGKLISSFSDDKPLVIISGYKCKEGLRLKPENHTEGRFAGITHYIYMASPDKSHVEGVTQHQRWMGWYPSDFPAVQIYSTTRGIEAIKLSPKYIDAYTSQFDHNIGRDSVNSVLINTNHTKLTGFTLTPNSRDKKYNTNLYTFDTLDEVLETIENLKSMGIITDSDIREHESRLIEIECDHLIDNDIPNGFNLGEHNYNQSKHSKKVKKLILEYLNLTNNSNIFFTYKDKTRYRETIKAIVNPEYRPGGRGLMEVKYLVQPDVVISRDNKIKIMYYPNYFRVDSPKTDTWYYFKTPTKWVLTRQKVEQPNSNKDLICVRLPEINVDYEKENEEINSEISNILYNQPKEWGTKRTTLFNMVRTVCSKNSGVNLNNIGPINFDCQMLNKFNSKSKFKSKIIEIINEQEYWESVAELKAHLKTVGITHMGTIASIIAFGAEHDVILMEQLTS